MRKTVIALAMCVTLAFSSLSTVCAASQWSTPASTTDEQKSYVEGEALAIVRGEARLQGPGRTEPECTCKRGRYDLCYGYRR